MKKYAIWKDHKVIGYTNLTYEQRDQLNKVAGIDVYFGYDPITNPFLYQNKGAKMNRAGYEYKKLAEMSDDFKVGERVRFDPIDFTDHSFDMTHRWFGEKGTIISKERFGVCIAFDNFPEVNNREYHNRFFATYEEIVHI